VGTQANVNMYINPVLPLLL